MTNPETPPVGDAAEASPYAHEYGKTNGDGTYSVVIERGNPRNPVPDWPVKPLFAHPPKAPIEPGVVEALAGIDHALMVLPVPIDGAGKRAWSSLLDAKTLLEALAASHAGGEQG